MISGIKGKSPSIDKSTFVTKNATVIGDVTIGERCGIWFGAVIRGDCRPIRIGDRTNIQDQCVLHVDDENGLTIGDDVTVGHRALLHGCTVGSRVLIGMGAIIMNGAKIGDDSIVGAGALVTEGSEIPSGSLAIGFPAKAKRELTREEISGIRTSSEHYVKTAELYLSSHID